MIILSIPAVQNNIAKRVTKSLNEEFATSIQIDKVDLSFLGRVGLKGVYIEDYKQDTLFYVDKLTTSLLSVRNAVNSNLNFGNISIEGLTMKLKTYEGENDTNLDVFVAKLEGTPDTTSTSNFRLTAKGIDITNSKFWLIDLNEEKSNLLLFNEMNAKVDDFAIIGPNVDAKIEKLAFHTGRGVNVEKLQTEFHYSLNEMRFEEFNLLTKNSDISGEIVFRYDRKDFGDFLNKVKIEAIFNDSEVALDEVNTFYNEFGQGKLITFSTDINGVLNDFEAQGMILESGNSIIRGDFNFKNIFTSTQPFRLDAGIENISSSYNQLKSLLPDILGNTLPSSFEKFGQFTIRGNSVITESFIDARVNLFTDLGSSYSDMKLTSIEDIDNASYEGFISLIEFDLGAFIDDPSLGQVSFDFDVNGKGFTKENLNTEVIGKVFKLHYNNYDYKDIDVSGVLKDQLFDGSMVSKDSNAKFTFKGLADLSSEKNQFNFIASVKYADLKKLNLIKTDSISIFKGNIYMNMSANTIDDAVGDIGFLKTSYQNQNDEYYFDDFKITSVFEKEERILEINSPDIITGTVKGKFKISEVGKLVENSIGSIYTNYSPYEVTAGQYMNFNFKIYNKIIDVFFPEVAFDPNTTLRGSMVADDGDFKLNFKSPHIHAFGKIFDEIKVQIDNKNPLFNTYVEVSNMDVGFYKIKDFNLINATIQDTLFFRTEFLGGKEYTDIYNLNFYHTFNKEKKSVIGLKKSEVGFKGNKWLLNENGNTKNKVVFNRSLDSISIRQIDMTLNEEQILLQGQLIDSTYKDIKLNFKDVALDKISPQIDSLNLKGVVNGDLNILQKGGNYFPSSRLFVKKLEVNSYTLGDLDLDIIGNEDFSKFTVDASLKDNGVSTLNLEGDAIFGDKKSTLDLNASLDNLNIAPFSPLGGDVISNIHGLVTGKARITGSAKNPSIDGMLMLNDAGLKIPYLNVDLSFNELAQVELYGQTFQFNNFELTDTVFNTKARFNGGITHTNFEEWFLNLKLETDGNRFLVLNTQFDEDELYYGTGFINGIGTIKGPTDALFISVTAETMRGTSFKIPISDVATIGDTSFINFIDKNETDEEAEQRKLREYSGLELEFDLDVTPEAEVQIVLDRKSGSMLTGTGAGNLLIEINTNGKFNMWGDFITFKGDYKYKYKGVFERDFSVLPGGTITWDGDPLNANVNIQAVYKTKANPAVLLDNNSVTRKIDTDVIIHLEGQLIQPQIDFEIDFPNTNPVTVAELQYRLEDKNRRELQAFSLLSQGTFVNEVTLSQQALAGNIAGFASSFINDIFGSNDGKFDFGFSYDVGERNPLGVNNGDRIGVTVSTQISDRILINGEIGVPVGGVTQSVVAGDVEVQILLNEEGTLSAKIFNKQNEIQQFLNDRLGYTQGVGLSYQVDFNTFKELWDKIFKKKKEDNEVTQNKEKNAQNKTPVVGEGILNFSSKNKEKRED
ncbi:translocation/assembly module TamB domain-containing protein [Ascidiimonas sp. W6]|uniref:translocation/assembly module TamB domain-containing protein n=1 Tax=Ascidiimonas meishanensis TaxID=3128903 RepID=UPI0030EBC17A